jgi:hypothetical protein
VKLVRRRLAQVLASLSVPVAAFGAPRKWS